MLVRPASVGLKVVSRADSALDELGIKIADAGRDIGRAAATLRARYTSLRLPDALVIATAVPLDADFLLTTDRRWTKLRQLGLRGRLVVVS